MSLVSIRAVLLDAGGVILHPNFDWIATRAAAEGVTVTRDQLHHGYYRMMHAVDCSDAMDREGMAVSTDAIRRFLIRRLLLGAGAPAEAAEATAPTIADEIGREFPRESDIFHFSMPGIRQRLQRLLDAGFALGVASNNDGALDDQLESVGLTDLLPVRLDSAKEGVSKPDPELLLRAARAVGVAPADCLYVGDIDRVDGAAARAAGMHFALLDPLHQPRPNRARTIASLDAIVEHFAAAG